MRMKVNGKTVCENPTSLCIEFEVDAAGEELEASSILIRGGTLRIKEQTSRGASLRIDGDKVGSLVLQGLEINGPEVSPANPFNIGCSRIVIEQPRNIGVGITGGCDEQADASHVMTTADVLAVRPL